MSCILIQNGLLIDTEWKRRADILVRGSKIVRIAPHIDPSTIPDNVTQVHADGMLVLPGIIDAHTHYHLVSRGTVTAAAALDSPPAAAISMKKAAKAFAASLFLSWIFFLVFITSLLL